MPTGKNEVSEDGGVSNDSHYRRPGVKRIKPNRKLNSITGVGMLRAGFLSCMPCGAFFHLKAYSPKNRNNILEKKRQLDYNQVKILFGNARLEEMSMCMFCKCDTAKQHSYYTYSEKSRKIKPMELFT